MKRKIDEHAVVIGGSVAGLLAARVLSDHFQRVTIIERDALVDEVAPRKGVPQGNHAHGLLTGGLMILEDLFPGFGDELAGRGAIATDPVRDVVWHQFDAYKLRFDGNLPGYLMSRPLIETTVRRRVLSLPNVNKMTRASARELIHDASAERVLGVVVEQRDAVQREVVELRASLVVDATGRGSRAPQWLAALGYGAPEESSVEVNLAYASRIYPRLSNKPNGYLVAEAPPHGTRGCAMLALEGNRWIVTLFGYSGDHPLQDEQGFLDFARSLPVPDPYEEIANAEPLSDIKLYKFPSNLRRHYEKMTRFPEGYLVLGDALCSFNPIYGQGMSVSAMQAAALQQTLQAADTVDPLARHFYKRARAIVDIPWTLASGADLAYEHVPGQRTLMTRLLNSYVGMVHRAAAVDQVVAQAFFNVANLTAQPPALFKPEIVWRVVRSQKEAHGRLSGRALTEPRIHSRNDAKQPKSGMLSPGRAH